MNQRMPAEIEAPLSSSSASLPKAESYLPAGVRMCKRCVLDSRVSGIKFDHEGICNHCKIHDKLNRIFPTGEEGEKVLRKMAAKIKASGRGKRYDCIVGLSGGRDTSYCLYVTKRLGLRPLALHFDNGWDSAISKNNIRRMCSKLDVDLECVIADWEESRELTNSTFYASVPYIDLTDDIGIITSLYRTAAREGIHWIIHSHSFRTEGINPLLWNYVDARYVRHLVNKFCRMPLKHFVNADMRRVLWWMLVNRIKVFTITNYYKDSGSEIDDFLKSEFGWEDTGGWHFDNEIFGLQCAYARRKFGIDWRSVELAALVREGDLTREEAAAKLNEVPLIEDDRFVRYALKKQGLSPEEFERLLAEPKKYFTDYPSYYPFIRLMKWPIWLASRLQYLPPHTFEKYFDV